MSASRLLSSLGQQRLVVVAVLVWVAMPLRAEVIDDFSGPKKFIVNGWPSSAACSLADGQLKITVPEGEGWAIAGHLRNYVLPEGEPVEFRADFVSANRAGVEVGLKVEFAGTGPGYYGIYRWYDRVVLWKGWGDQGCGFYDRPVETGTDPLTLSLTLTRQGTSLNLAAKVVLRDNLQVVFADWQVLDTPGRERAELNTDGPGPPQGAITVVGLDFMAPEGAGGQAEAVFDNLVCSHAATPDTVTIRPVATGDVELGWNGASLALTADTVSGPWRPCAQSVGDSLSRGASPITLAASASQQFFRVVSGISVHEPFTATSSLGGMVWKIGPAVAEGTAAPAFGPTGGRGRVLGMGSRNADFVLRKGLIGWLQHDGVTSVDIVDWDETMEEASFGLVLRAKPATDLWAADTDGLPHDRYAGLLTFKQVGSPSESVLSLTGPGGEVLELRRFPAVDPARQYRLRFWAVGDRLTLELFDLAQPEVPIVTCAATDARLPAGLEALCGTKSASDRYDVTIDNWVLNAVIK